MVSTAFDVDVEYERRTSIEHGIVLVECGIQSRMLNSGHWANVIADDDNESMLVALDDDGYDTEKQVIQVHLLNHTAQVYDIAHR